MSQFDLYSEITKQIMEMLEKGVVPWRSPIMGRGTAGHPKNLDSGKPYRGINTFLLAFTAYAKGYGSSYWMTWNQIQEAKGHVRKGEKSTMVIFFKEYQTEDRQTHDPKTVPVMRYYRVFNLDQTEGIAIPDAPAWQPIQFEPLEAAEIVVGQYEGRPEIIHEGTKAFWRPSTDKVHMPPPERFTSREEYYSTAFHELGHSTGHSSRLDRKLDTEPHAFGTLNYGREELVAEMCAAYLSAHCQISPPVITQQAAYLQGWLKVLKEDKKLVVGAASAAQKAADWILGNRNQTPP